MLPISVDLRRIRVILVGDGEAARRRLRLLEEAGADALEIYAPSPGPALSAEAGERLRQRLPRRAEIARAQLVFVAGVAGPAAAEIRRIAREAGVLINVEDDVRRSNFHSAAVIRRGELSVAVSTGGRSPGLAALMRRVLEQQIGPEWGLHLDEIAALRAGWREAEADPGTVVRWTQDWVARQGWLDATPPEASQSESRPIA
ncbi:MAG TPA: NAD(P)-dependent oxidoreductase [Stellaceae bacterium]|jgi:precorrin-2 dehydrogenase/sirohydrochlorin ferrochelatase